MRGSKPPTARSSIINRLQVNRLARNHHANMWITLRNIGPQCHTTPRHLSQTMDTLWQVVSIIWLASTAWVFGLTFAVWTIPRLLRKRRGEYGEPTVGQIIQSLLLLASGLLAVTLAFHLRLA